MSYYAANGSVNVTVVDGSVYTGLYAADGSINVVKATGSVYVGAYHPCGAKWVTLSPGSFVGVQAPDGSMYVNDTGSVSTNSGQPVTVVSGSLRGYAADVLSINSLVGYWRGTDKVGSATLKDFSASNLPATIIGGVTLGSTPLLTGVTDTSALFNGSTGTASLGAAGETFLHNWDLNQPFTIEALVIPNLNRAGGFSGQAILSKQSTTSPFPGWEFGLYFNDAVSFGTVAEFYLSNQAGTTLRINSSVDMPNGVERRVVLSYDGSGAATGLNMWIDGVLDRNTTGVNLTGSIVTSIVPQIGSRNNVQFYNAGNIQELSLSNKAVGDTTPSLVASNVMDAGKPMYHYGLSVGRTPLASIPRPPLIVDTDISTDIGDVGALTLAAILHKRNECNLIGVVTNSNDDRSADAAYAILKYLIPSTVPSFVGAWQGTVANPGGASPYTTDISTTFGQNLGRASYTDSIQKYRSLLMAQPDNSVVIASIGFFNNLDGLLTSAANAGGDGFGTGVAIITQKVKRIVAMGGGYASGTAEFNLHGAPAASSHFFANCPVEIVVTGTEIGATTLAGPGSIASSLVSPVQQAWHDWGTATRPLWDEIAVLTAVRGVNSNSGITQAGLRGTNTVNATTGDNAWTWTAGNTSYTRKSAADTAFNALVNSMYAALPNAF